MHVLYEHYNDWFYVQFGLDAHSVSMGNTFCIIKRSLVYRGLDRKTDKILYSVGYQWSSIKGLSASNPLVIECNADNPFSLNILKAYFLNS